MGRAKRNSDFHFKFLKHKTTNYFSIVYINKKYLKNYLSIPFIRNPGNLNFFSTHGRNLESF